MANFREFLEKITYVNRYLVETRVIVIYGINCVFICNSMQKLESVHTAWVTVYRQLWIPALCKMRAKPQRMISKKINLIYCSKRNFIWWLQTIVTRGCFDLFKCIYKITKSIEKREDKISVFYQLLWKVITAPRQRLKVDQLPFVPRMDRLECRSSLALPL